MWSLGNDYEKIPTVRALFQLSEATRRGDGEGTTVGVATTFLRRKQLRILMILYGTRWLKQ